MPVARRANAGLASVPDKPGELYTTTGDDVWEVVSFFAIPSVTLKNIQTGETLTGGVGCLNFKDFRRLVPAE
jgi:hypothetical protein